MAAHSYWRLNITAHGATSFVGLAELTFADAGGAAIATTGGTASASGNNGPSTIADKAFDGDINTFWQDTAPIPGTPRWIQYHFASSVDVSSASIRSLNNTSYYDGPQDFDLQYSDDGSSFTTLHSYKGVGWASQSQVRSFTAANAAPVALGIAWRLLITQTNGNSFAGIANWFLYDAAGNAISTAAHSGSASSYYSNGTAETAGLAFGGDASDMWQSNNDVVGGNSEWLRYDFGSVVGVSRICIQARPDSSFSAQSPSAFSVQYSYDGTAWTTAETISGWTWTSPGQITCANVHGGPSGGGTGGSNPGHHQRGNIDWDQIGMDARQGADFGILVQYSDGTFTPGNTPHYLADGTLGDSGSSSGGSGGTILTVNGTATVQVNGVATSFDDQVLVNGA